MTLQDRLDELTTDRDRRFQERESDRVEQVNGTDYNPIEVNPWTGQAGDVVSNGQIPPGMPITELQDPEGDRTIEGPNSPRPRPKPKPKKPYLETFKPIVIGYLVTEEYTADDKLFSACYVPPGRVAVLFTVERDTGSPVDYTCPRYEFQWREDGDAECRPTPDPSAPYNTMSACLNDPKNRVWQARDGTPLGVNQAQYPDEPPHEDYADKGGSTWLLLSNEQPAYSYGLLTIFWKYKILIPGDNRNDGQWRLIHGTVNASGSSPRLTALRSWMRSNGIEAESQIEYHHLESVLAVSGDRHTSYYSIDSGYKIDAHGNLLIPNGTPASYTVVEWMQSQVRAPGGKTSYGDPKRRSYRVQREFWRLGSGFSYAGWFPVGEGDYGGDPPPPDPLPIPEREVPARWKRPEEGEATTVARQYWVSEPSNNPETYKQPYKILEINAEDESIGYIAYDGIHAQGFIKYGRHLVDDEEQWCEVMQFGNRSPDPWNSGVGKSKDLNPPDSLNRSACGKQFASSLEVNVSPSLGKVIEIDPNQLVRSITSTPTTPVQLPLDQELEIAVADARMNDPDVRDIVVKVKVQDILPESGCNLSPVQEKDAIVNRFMLQSLASTATEIAPGYPIEDVPKNYSPIWGTNTPPSGGSKEGKQFYYYWRHSNGEDTRVEIPVEILRTDPVKAYLTQTDDKSAIAVFKVGERTEQGETEPKACRVIRAKILVDGDESSVSIEDSSIDTELLDVSSEDWQSSYTRDRLINPEIPDSPAGTMVQWNIDNEQRGNLRIEDSQAIVLEGIKEEWAAGQALKVKVWAITDFPNGVAEEIESNFAPISEGSVLIVAASAVLATSE